MSLNYLCIWQVLVSVYCAWRISSHLRCTQCSILLHLIDICFLTCICLYHILQIQTRLCDVVGPGFISTSPAFMRSRASPPAGPFFTILHTFLEDDELHIIIKVLTRVTYTGVPHGDYLSALLFILYLAQALNLQEQLQIMYTTTARQDMMLSRRKNKYK